MWWLSWLAQEGQWLHEQRFKLCNYRGVCTSQTMGMQTNSFFKELSASLIQNDFSFCLRSQKNSRWWPDTDLYFGFITLQTASNDGPDGLPFSYHPTENKLIWRRAEFTGLSVQSSDGSWNLEEFLALSSRTNRRAVGTQLPCAWSMISSHVQSFRVRLKRTTLSGLQSHFQD